MTTLQPAAVLWDMDGTIVDTEPYWIASETRLVEEFGGSWRQSDALGLVGQGLWHSARVLQNRGVTLSEDEIIQSLTSRVLEMIDIEVPWRPGAKELLFELRQASVKTALVTMSIKRMADHVAGAIDFAAFDAIVAGDTVTHSKPHPEPYLRGAQLLGVNAQDCVAIEDSEPGLASAVAAGTTAIGVPAHTTILEGPDYTLWPTLHERTIGDLAAVHFTAQSKRAV
ncbi:MAG: HAD family phosphatase [Microbacteriaceae bacterium]